MNCARYRFLIQQRFDVEIAPQDDHSLLIHLESCDSCQKFHHQVQQVILASEELPIPEELLPQKLETLARSVIEQLPQPKPGLFAGLLQMFKKDSAPKVAPNGATKAPPPKQQSAFPHRRGVAAQSNTGEVVPARFTEEDAQQAQSMSSKMRNMSKFAPPEQMQHQAPMGGDSREAQSSTRSLGEKFGVQAPNADSLMNDQSLTLAEAIRRKVSENPKQGQDSSGSQSPISGPGVDQWAQGSAGAPFKPVAGESGNWGTGFGAPPPQPGVPGTDPSEWKLFSNSGAPPAPAAPGAAQNENQRVESWASGDAWEQTGEAPGAAGAPAAKFGGAPAAVPPVAPKDPWGDIGTGAGAGKGAAATDPWGDIGIKPGGNDAWSQSTAKAAVPPIAPPAKPAGGDPWAQPMGAPNQDPWGQPTASPGSDPWGQPTAGGSPDPWQLPNAPAPQAQPPVSAAPSVPKMDPLPAPAKPAPQPPPGGDWGPAPQLGTWDAPADFKDNWQRKSEPELPVAAKPVMKMDEPAPAQPPGWSNPPAAAPGGYGNFASQVEPAPATDPWSNAAQFAQAPTQQPSADPWSNPASFNAPATPGTNQSAGGWGKTTPNPTPNPTPEPAKPAAADGWNSAPAAPPKPVAPEPAPGGDPWSSAGNFSGASSWGDAPKPVAPQNPAADTWNNASNSGWSAPAAPQPAAPNAPSQPAPNPFANTNAPAPPSNGWETPAAAADQDNGWNTPAPTTASGTNPAVGWNKPGALGAGLGNSPWSAGDAGDKKAPTPPVSKQIAKLPAYSLEAEQVETGTWKAFRPDETLGAKTPAPAAPAPAPHVAIPPPAPTDPVPVPGASTEDWDLPIQEKLKRQKARSEGAITSNQLEAPAGSAIGPTGGFAAPPAAMQPQQPQTMQQQPVQPQPMQPQPMQPQPMQPAAQAQPPAPAVPTPNAGVSSWANLNNPMGEQTLKHNIPDADLWGIPNETPAAVGAGAQNSFDPSKNPFGNGAGTPNPQPAMPAPAAAVSQAPGLSAAPAVTASSWDLQVIQASEQLGYDAPSSGGMPFGSSIINQSPVGAAAQGSPTTMSQPKISPVPTKQTFPGYSEFNANPPAAPAPQQAPPQPFAQAPQAVPQPAPAPEPAPASSSDDRRMFQLDDSAMDKLFSENLGVQERSIKPAAPAPAPAPVQPPAPIPAPIPTPPVQPAIPPQPAQGAWGPAPTAQQNTWGTPPQQAAPQPAPQAPQPAPKAPDPWQNSSSAAPTPGVQPWPQAAAPAPAPAPAPTPAPAPWANVPTTPPAPAQPAPVQPAWPQSAPQPASAPWQQAPAAPAPAPAIPTPSTYAAPSNEANQPNRLFSIDDSVMDRIFADNLGIKDETPVSAAPPSFPTAGAQPQAPAPAPVPVPPKASLVEAVKQITEIAVSSPLPPPKIEGLGRLDARPDTTTESGSGRISSIGKFLLDGKDLEKIGKITSSDLSDTTMRILTMEAASELQSLLQHIGSQHGVLGSVIVGHDGLLIANTMPPEIEGESLGIWALAVYMNTQNAARSLGNDRVYQIVSKTPRGYLIIADFGSGLLVTVTDATDSASLVSLMRNITQLVAA